MISRFDKFVVRKHDEPSLAVTLLCSNYDWGGMSSSKTVFLPDGFIINDNLELKMAFDKNIPFDMQLADELEIEFDSNILRNVVEGEEDFRPLLPWIMSNGIDNTTFSNGTTDSNTLKYLFKLDYIPNVWMITKGNTVLYIGVQTAAPNTETVLSKEVNSVKLKTYSLHKFLCEKIIHQYIYPTLALNLDIDYDYLRYFNNDFATQPYEPNSTNFESMKIMNLVKDHSGKKRFSYHFLRDANFSMLFGKVSNLFNIMNLAYSRLAMIMMRNSHPQQNLITNFYQNLTLPNPYLSFGYYRQDYNSTASHGEKLAQSDLYINIGTFSAREGVHAPVSDTNLWNFYTKVLAGLGQRMSFNYNTLRLVMTPIYRNFQSCRVIDDDMIGDGDVKLINLSDNTTKIQVKTTNSKNSDTNNFERKIEFSDSNETFSATMPISNLINRVERGDSDGRRYWNYYDSKTWKEFPLMKIFYIDEAERATEGDYSRYFQVASACEHESYDFYLSNPHTLYNFDWTTISSHNDFNTACNSLAKYSQTGLMADIYQQMLFNKKNMLINFKSTRDYFEATDFGKMFNCNFNRYFKERSGYDRGNCFILSGITLNYINNEVDLTFFIRGDNWANVNN